MEMGSNENDVLPWRRSKREQVRLTLENLPVLIYFFEDNPLIGFRIKYATLHSYIRSDSAHHQMSLQCAVSAHLLNDFTPVARQGFAALDSQLKIRRFQLDKCHRPLDDDAPAPFALKTAD